MTGDCPNCGPPRKLSTGGRCWICGYGTAPQEQVVIGDPVNHPSHYGQGEIEAIDYIKDFLTEEEFIGYCRGNIAKYLHRWRYKNGKQDLEKAEWYLKKLIETQ